MPQLRHLLWLGAWLAGTAWAQSDAPPVKRINKAIELLEHQAIVVQITQGDTTAIVNDIIVQVVKPIVFSNYIVEINPRFLRAHLFKQLQAC
jgi:hypothetical protein